MSILFAALQCTVAKLIVQAVPTFLKDLTSWHGRKPLALCNQILFGQDWFIKYLTMYEIFGVIDDELGTRSGPTGMGALQEATAQLMMKKLQREHPAHRFYVEFVPSSDSWNMYDS